MAGDRPLESWHPEGRWLDVDGVRAHVVRRGPRDRPTLVLLHGFLMSSWAWRRNIDELSDEFDVIAPCLRGFGWSERDKGRHDLPGLGQFVLSMLDKLEVEKFSVIGNSLGGALAIWLARVAPEQVERLCLVNALAIRDLAPKVPALLTMPFMAPLYRVAIQPTVARLGLQVLAYKGIRVGAEYLAGFREQVRPRRTVRTMLSVARDLTAIVEWVDAELEKITQPVLITWGDRDGILGARPGPILKARIANARLITFPECGHCPHEEAPERFNAAVRAFFA
jgi:pimeloyl-ACP methyl ester carboxylesterase